MCVTEFSLTSYWSHSEGRLRFLTRMFAELMCASMLMLGVAPVAGAEAIAAAYDCLPVSPPKPPKPI